MLLLIFIGDMFGEFIVELLIGPTSNFPCIVNVMGKCKDVKKWNWKTVMD